MPRFARIMLLSLLALTGCGNVSIIFVTLSPSGPIALDSGQSVTITANVMNDPSSSGVTWSLIGNGTLTSQTPTTVVYTAPSGVSASATSTVTAIPIKNTLFAAAVQILQNPAPTISPVSLQPGTINVPYSQQFSVSGGNGPFAWAITSGTLPTGISFSSAGLLSGTPTAIGSFPLTVKVTDSANTPYSFSEAVTLNISATAMTITTTSIPNGVVGTPISQQLTVSGGNAPYTWSVSGGALPPGVSLSSSGLLSGTPTANAIYSVTVQVKDTEPAPQTKQATFSFTIYSALTITTTTLPVGSLHNAYSASLQYTGGTTPVTWSLAAGSSLPAGLTLSSAGVISGTPTAVANTTFTVQLTDHSSPPQVVTATLSINIVLSTLAITTTTLPQGTVGTAYSSTLQSSGGNPPVTWSLATGSGPLPTGITLSSAGVISGTSNNAGTYPITVQATDSTPASVTQALSLTIVPLATLTITTTTVPSGNVGSAYSTTLAATGGAVPYTWTITAGALPQGLSLSTAGVLSGTPLVVGSFTFTVQVKDSQATPATATRQFTMTIGSTLGTGVNNAQISGTYAFLLNGFNVGSASGAVYGYSVLGSVVANGTGGLTGTEYINAPTGVQTAVAITGSYTLGSDGRGFMTLTAGTTTNIFTIAAGPLVSNIAQTLSISEFDNSTGATGSSNITGIAKLQTTSAFAATTLTGTFAFGLSGESPCSTCVTPAPLYGPIAAAGLFTANGTSTISAGQEDAAAYGTNYTGVTLTGTFTAPSTTTGIGALHFVTTGTLFSAPPADFYYAIINANEMLLMSSDTHATNALLFGDAQLQRQTTYSATSLAGTLIGYESQGNGGNGSTAYPTTLNAILSDVAITGSGTATLAQDANRAGTFSSTAAAPVAITYTTSANGRTAITTGSASNQILYLYNTSTGFALDQAATSVYPALLVYQQQTAVAPYPVILSGSYAAFTAPTSAPAADTSGIYAFSPNSGGVDGTISGDLTTTLDSSSTAGSLSFATKTSLLYNESSTGRHVVTPVGTTTTQAIVYGINSGLAVEIPATSTTTPTVTVLQTY